MRLVALILPALLLCGGCTTTTGSSRWFGELQWRTGVARRGLDPERVLYPFRAGPRMRAWARRVTALERADTDRLRALQQALFDDHEFTFEYAERRTLTPAEAFTERRGNCLAFTALFIALSRSLGLTTVLVSVNRQASTAHGEDLVVVNRHVVAGYPAAGRIVLYDFFRRPSAPYSGYRILDDVMASALFYVNFGGVAVEAGDLDTARRDLETAIRLAPSLAIAWVNLGVVRRRAGDLPGAVEAYGRALALDPGNPSALTNLAYVYGLQGKQEEARLALLAASHGRSTAYSLVALADAEMAAGRLREARRALKRARAAGREVPEVWEAMARLATRRGRPGRAERYARRALELRAGSDEGRSGVHPDRR